MGRHFDSYSYVLCVRRLTDANNITHTHINIIYTVFMYIQCKQWLNISLWLPGVHRMNDFHQFRMASRTKKPVEDKETPKNMRKKVGCYHFYSCVFCFFVIVWCVFPICWGGFTRVLVQFWLTQQWWGDRPEILHLRWGEHTLDGCEILHQAGQRLRFGIIVGCLLSTSWCRISQ